MEQKELYRKDLVTDYSLYNWNLPEAVKDTLKARPDAIIALDDAQAESIIRAIKEAGLRVPEDIAVTGFNNSFEALRSRPHITTIVQPFFEIGVRAAEIMMARIKNNSIKQAQESIDGNLIVRDSTVRGDNL